MLEPAEDLQREPTEAARQRWADLANRTGYVCPDIGPDYVQQMHDKASEIVRVLDELPPVVRYSEHCKGVADALTLARSMMLPEPKDELVEALEAIRLTDNPEAAEELRAHFAKQGKELIIRKVGE